MVTYRKLIAQKLSENKGFLLCLFLLFSIRWSFADHYRVPSGSMQPTIQIGDHLFVNKMAYGLKIPFTNIQIAEIAAPQRGDIVVFQATIDPNINMVKRLIGLPGDNIEIDNGILKINGRSTLTHPQILDSIKLRIAGGLSPFRYSETIDRRKFLVERLPKYASLKKQSFVVPPEHYFFMGDNRDNSSDSRFWGFVPRKNLKGQVKNVTLSIAFEGLIPKINFQRFGKTII